MSSWNFPLGMLDLGSDDDDDEDDDYDDEDDLDAAIKEFLVNSLLN